MFVPHKSKRFVRYNTSMLDAFVLFPTWYQYSFVLGVGLIIGSFLNVVIYRYHTGKSINGHSHCLSCGTPLRWYELFPLVSYLCLLGRCRGCGCKIPFRYFLVELGTATLFLLAFINFSTTLLFIFTLFLIAVLMVVAVYDIYHMVIPNQLVLQLGVLAGLYYLVQFGLTFELSIFLSHLGASFGAFMFYGGLWFVSKGRWIGFGDAKLALPLGFILGAPAVFSFVVFSFWIGAVVSVALLGGPAFVGYILARYASDPVANSYKSFTMKSEVPFAPFMILAFLAVYLYGFDVIALTALFI